MKRRNNFTPFVQRVVIEAIAAGNHYHTAAAAAGISYQTLQQWLEMGRKGASGYADFTRKVEQAEAESEALAVSIIQKHAQGFVKKIKRTIVAPDGVTETTEEHEESDWRAAHAILQGRFANRWNLARKLQFSGALDVRQHVIIHTDPKDAQRIIEAEEGLLMVEGKDGALAPLLEEGTRDEEERE